MKYSHSVEMYSSDTDRWLKSVEAYTSQTRAEKACDRLNTYNHEDPYYGRVYYEVMPRN